MLVVADIPIILKWPAPNPEIEDFHENESECNIASKYLDGNVLFSFHSQTSVHDEHANLDRPNREDLALFNNNSKLATVDALTFLFCCERRYIETRREKIGGVVGNNIDGNDESGVCADCKKHDIVINLEALYRA